MKWNFNSKLIDFEILHILKNSMKVKTKLINYLKFLN